MRAISLVFLLGCSGSAVDFSSSQPVEEAGALASPPPVDFAAAVSASPSKPMGAPDADITVEASMPAVDAGLVAEASVTTPDAGPDVPSIHRIGYVPTSPIPSTDASVVVSTPMVLCFVANTMTEYGCAASNASETDFVVFVDGSQVCGGGVMPAKTCEPGTPCLVNAYGFQSGTCVGE